MNKALLKSEVIKSNKTMDGLAKYLGINYVTLNRKMNGTSDFTRNEIVLARDYLGLTNDDVERIFFA